ncbi:MAG TPA: GNAT family N-acetyltransferase [Pyrinomonadaceae bacterium]|jgi:predicted GNAT family N-acyltransferase
MRIEIRVAEKVTDEEHERLSGWGEDLFGTADLNIRWRPKDWHIILEVDGLIASHVGVLEHTVEVEGQPVKVGGIGSVITVGEMHGRGYAHQALRRAEQFMCEELKVEFGLLFCLDRLMPFYQRQGWQLVREPVEYDQPLGKVISQLNVMVLPCRGQSWPAGKTDLRSLPW